MNWVFFAIGSAFFAGLTAILGKLGVEGINSNLATCLLYTSLQCHYQFCHYTSIDRLAHVSPHEHGCLHLFVGRVDSSQAKGLHGLAEENEDIRVHVVKREQAYRWMCDGKIDNGIAVMGLQWLQLNYAQLQQRWR